MGDGGCKVGLILSPRVKFSRLLGSIIRGFGTSDAFFGGTGLTLSFRKEGLSRRRRRRVVSTVRDGASVRVLYVIRGKAERRTIVGRRIRTFCSTMRRRCRGTTTKGKPRRFCHNALESKRIVSDRSDIAVVNSIGPKTGVVSRKGVIVLKTLGNGTRTKYVNSHGYFVFTLSVRPVRVRVKSLVTGDPSGPRPGHHALHQSGAPRIRTRVTVTESKGVCVRPVAGGVLGGV